jgi:hypothetical protein
MRSIKVNCEAWKVNCEVCKCEIVENIGCINGVGFCCMECYSKKGERIIMEKCSFVLCKSNIYDDESCGEMDNRIFCMKCYKKFSDALFWNQQSRIKCMDKNYWWLKQAIRRGEHGWKERKKFVDWLGTTCAKDFAGILEEYMWIGGFGRWENELEYFQEDERIEIKRLVWENYRPYYDVLENN